ncbi:response regulator [Parvularcula sp. IMCC14364]|uniref:response regulator n=1 Tax=Parvularcula sp. IMCC14364 TaxID=3067902 RepID=UPI002741A992|nr:response regulator [Parvularcula sp. IMCC14364]
MAICLVVDDSDVIRLITRKILENLGHSIIDAPTAEEAVSICATDMPEVVFLDWDLPSLGALDFLKGLSEIKTQQRPAVVLCATENDAQQFALARSAGARHHVLKPYELSTIRAVLEQAGFQGEEAQAVAS